MGGLIGFTTVALPQLQKNDSILDPNNTKNMDIYLNDEQASWVAAIPLITGIPITPFGGLLGGLVGRRNIMLYTHPFVIIGLIVVANAPSFAVILIGRMIISAGICSHVSSVGKNIEIKSMIFKLFYTSLFYTELSLLVDFHTVRNWLYTLLNSGRLLTICSVSREYKWAINEEKIEIQRRNDEKEWI